MGMQVPLLPQSPALTSPPGEKWWLGFVIIEKNHWVNVNIFRKKISSIVNQTLQLVLGLLRLAFKPVAYSLLGGSVVLLVIGIVFLNNKPDLSVWHTYELEHEFNRKLELTTFADYLQLEERLFQELEDKVVAPLSNSDQAAGIGSFNRYLEDGQSSPRRWPQDWNRSYELVAEKPVSVVLLLHGMSDSPYSMRALAKSLHASGSTVLVLRLPGHGTLPAALVDVKWEDMAAAVELAIGYLVSEYPDVPVQLLGYSNGATLGLNYLLDVLERPELPKLSKLVFISPSIEISAFARFAIWQGRFGRWLGLQKLEWQSVMMEYDPFKYGSFAINAGDQVYRLTTKISKQLDRAARRGLLEQLPPILAFQSVVDATVSSEAVVNEFIRLKNPNNRLVIFGLNRRADVAGMIKNSPSKFIARLFQRSDLEFKLGLITNVATDSMQVQLRSKAAQSTVIEYSQLDLRWPEGVFSLSHVAMPFPATDSLYGAKDLAMPGPLNLGHLDFRGERGVLAVPAVEMLRQRWNPFFYWMETEIQNFLQP